MFSPATLQLLNVRQDGTEFNFTSTVPPDWTLNHWRLFAACVLQHIARNAKIDLHDLYHDMTDEISTVADMPDLMMRHDPQ